MLVSPGTTGHQTERNPADLASLHPADAISQSTPEASHDPTVARSLRGARSCLGDLELPALRPGRVPEVLDECVRAGEDLGLVTVLPTHKVGGLPALAEHLQDLAVSLRLTLMVTANHEAVARAGPEL
jgi:hypothetical protein